MTRFLAIALFINFLAETAFVSQIRAVDLDPRNVPVCMGMTEGDECTKVNGHRGKCTMNPCTNQLACIYEQEIAEVKAMCKK